MDNNKGFAPIAIVLIITAVLVVGGIAYYAGKSSSPVPQNAQDNNYQPQVDNSATQNNTLVPATDKTANWKTYTDNVYGFEIKYPSNWFQSIHGNNLVLTNINVTGGDAPTLSISGGTTPDINSLKDCKVVNFAGVSAHQCLTGSDWLYTNEPVIYFSGNNIPFVVYDNINSETSHQILSTFKFTSSSVVAENMVVKVYFAPQNSEQLGCNDVVAAERTVPKTISAGTVALEELFKGPTTEEKAKGYTTGIPTGSKLNSLVIVNGEARADFNSITESGGGSCSMGIRTTQIRQTLLQFPTIKTVLISINGRTKDIFQP